MDVTWTIGVAIVIAIYDYFLIRGHRKHVAGILKDMNAQHKNDMERIHQEILQAVSKEYPEKLIQYQELINEITKLRQLALEGKYLLQETLKRAELPSDDILNDFFRRVHSFE